MRLSSYHLRYVKNITFLERTYILDRWLFCLQCRECVGRNAKEIYRKSRIKAVRAYVKGI